MKEYNNYSGCVDKNNDKKWWDIKWSPQKVIIRKTRIKKIFQ